MEQRLSVRIHRDELDPFQAGRDHPIDGIAAASADAHHLYAGKIFHCRIVQFNHDYPSTLSVFQRQYRLRVIFPCNFYMISIILPFLVYFSHKNMKILGETHESPMRKRCPSIFFEEIAPDDGQVLEDPQPKRQECHIVEIDAQMISHIDQKSC